MIKEERVLNRFLDYVKIDSESYDEKSFGERVVKDLEAIGVECEVDNSGETCGSNFGNIIGRINGSLDKEPILFSCHMDTVVPGKGIKPIVKDGVVYSDGTTILGGDDKGGIASILEALTSLKEENIPHGPVEIVFTIAEEVGMWGSKNLDYSKIKSKIGYVFDTSGDPGSITIKGPAQDKIVINIEGKPAHAGVAPEEGISAIQIASDAIAKMKLLRIDENTTANIGTIKGGVATNVVCPSVTIEAEARSTVIESLDVQTKHMVDTFKEVCESYGGKISIDVSRLYGEFVVSENDKVVLNAKKAFEKMGINPTTTQTGGGSDTNIFNGNGIKAVNLSSGERKPHTKEEFMKVCDLVKVAEVVKNLIIL
ncbi:MAG: M20/M25/M40 family metallo-hydrolase [Clostridium sp.]